MTEDFLAEMIILAKRPRVLKRNSLGQKEFQQIITQLPSAASKLSVIAENSFQKINEVIYDDYQKRISEKQAKDEFNATDIIHLCKRLKSEISKYSENAKVHLLPIMKHQKH